jgi:hypothetical protein
MKGTGVISRFLTFFLTAKKHEIPQGFLFKHWNKHYRPDTRLRQSIYNIILLKIIPYGS